MSEPRVDRKKISDYEALGGRPMKADAKRTIRADAVLQAAGFQSHDFILSSTVGWNKAVTITHGPTGTVQSCNMHATLFENRSTAYMLLAETLAAAVQGGDQP